MIKDVYIYMDNLKVVDLTEEEIKELKEFDYDLDLIKEKEKKEEKDGQDSKN